MSTRMSTRLLQIVGILISLLLRENRAVDENYALNGTTYQYDAYDDNCTKPSLAVDGSLLRDMNTCKCAQTGSAIYLPYRPWWVVKLRKWTQVTSFRVIGSQIPNDTAYSFLVSPFWNESLPSIVPSTGLSSDPLKNNSFSLLYTHNGSLHDFPNASVTFNATFGGAGRYFAVQSPYNPVMLCEMQVFGKSSLLPVTNALSILTDNPVYRPYNMSVLTDDREDTCLQLGSVKDRQKVIFQSVSALPAQFSVNVISKGGLQGQSSRTCLTGTALRVTMRYMQEGAWVEEPLCRLAQVQSTDSLWVHRFECNCNGCSAMLVVELGWSGVTQMVQICEILVFSSSLPSADDLGLNNNNQVSIRPECEATGVSYCCPKQPVISVKYSFWNLNAAGYSTAAVISGYSPSFTKAFGYTDLHVVMSMNTRILTGCGRIFLTYNGVECVNPGPTELYLYSQTTGNIHWTTVLEGICKGIPAGNVAILFNVAMCGGSPNMYFARDSTTRLMIEEVEPTQTSLTEYCLHATAFNTKQYLFSVVSNSNSGVIYAANYTKSVVETGLKMTFYGMTRNGGTCGGPSECCAYWQFTVNGSPCSNPGPIMGKIVHNSPAQDYHFPSMFTGICYGIPAGNRAVAIEVGNCPGYTGTNNVQTSAFTATRVLVEEVRLSAPFISAKLTPVFNLRYYYFNMSSTADTGQLMSVNYTKTRSDTALRVSWLSDVRLNAAGGLTYHNEWHMLFNGQECADPGIISHSFLIVGPNPSTGVRTARNFGICRGILAGNAVISVNVGYSTDTLGDVTTTGGVNVIIEEVILTP